MVIERFERAQQRREVVIALPRLAAIHFVDVNVADVRPVAAQELRVCKRFVSGVVHVEHGLDRSAADFADDRDRFGQRVHHIALRFGKRFEQDLHIALFSVRRETGQTIAHHFARLLWCDARHGAALFGRPEDDDGRVLRFRIEIRAQIKERIECAPGAFPLLFIGARGMQAGRRGENPVQANEFEIVSRNRVADRCPFAGVERGGIGSECKRRNFDAGVAGFAQDAAAFGESPPPKDFVTGRKAQRPFHASSSLAMAGYYGVNVRAF